MRGALYRAYFIDNITVGEVEEMLMIVAALDLDGEGARHVLESHSFSDTIEGNWPYPGNIVRTRCLLLSRVKGAAWPHSPTNC
ncbi:MAG: hypothetical protein NZ936_01085 [Alphaproteobacteria bacterium]|nr:hypothetical protein [Alphaproteobacteria bacterium]